MGDEAIPLNASRAMARAITICNPRNEPIAQPYTIGLADLSRKSPGEYRQCREAKKQGIERCRILYAKNWNQKKGEQYGGEYDCVELGVLHPLPTSYNEKKS